MSFDPGELREFLDAELHRAFGTSDPTDEELRALYQRTRSELYPGKDRPAPLREKTGRERMKVLRRALEQTYPWLRLDPAVRAADRIRRPARSADIIKNAWNNDGIVVLRRAQVNGQDAIEQFSGVRPSDQPQLLPPRHPALTVLLARLWHYEGVLDGEVPTRLLEASQPSAGVPGSLYLRGSAMPLEQLMSRL